jgi:hypothetical protein
MVADRWIPPTIVFAEQPSEGGIVAKFAYLVRVKGAPWAFANLDEVHMDPHDAVAVRLDPRRIAEETNNETGRTYYAYLAEPPASQG